MPKKEVDRLSLDDRPMAICGSINFKDYTALDVGILSARFGEYLDNWLAIKEYYYIFHTETDTLHLHYILIFKKQQYVSTCLNRLCESVGVDTEAVNYRKLMHRNAHLRYMLHIDAESIKLGKQKYEVYQITTNINNGLMSCFVNSKDDDKTIDFLTLEGICVQFDGNELLIAEFLDSLYRKYRNEIRLILDHFSYVRLKFDKLSDSVENLPFNP